MIMSEPPADITNDHPDDDRVLEQWLREAYPVPVMPCSIGRRIQAELASQNGSATGSLINSQQTVPAWWSGSRASRWLVAASIAAVLLVSVIWRGGSTSAWAAMVDALEQRGVVQLSGPDADRWLALDQGLLGERTAEATRLIDLQHQLVLVRYHAEGTVQQQRWHTSTATADRDRLVLGFLLGTTQVMEDRGLVLKESRIAKDQDSTSGSRTLHCRWTDTDSQVEDYEFVIRLDRETLAPLDVQLPQAGIPAAVQYFAYTNAETSSLIAAEFPDHAEFIGSKLTGSDATLQLTQADPSPAVTVSTLPSKNTDDVRPTFTHDGAPAGPLAGPAVSWPPVAVITRSQAEVVQEIDRILEQHWQQQNLDPVPLAEDEELLRRVYLDLLGRTPTVYEIRTYLADSSSNRYERRVDQLLHSPDHYSHLATVWRTFLIPDGIDLTAFGGVEAFDRWLADRFTKERSYARIVQELLLAEGRLSRSGPLLFYCATKLNPDELAARTARVFLGTRLECAQCHDHPFEPWTQQDFWSLAAYFAQISRPQTNLQTVSTVMQVRDVDRGDVKLPETETVVMPRVLNSATISLGDVKHSRRSELATWITDRKNPYFPRATANRLWDLLFGQGIVNPVDDFGTQHPPRSPELLEVLASKLVQDDFNLQELLKIITLSRAYRLSSGAPTSDDRRLEWFAQMSIKSLSAEQMYDCISVATMLDNNSDGAVQLNRFNNVSREQFLQEFRTLSARRTEYQGGIPQALTLMNGTLIENATGLSTSGLLKSLEAPFFSNRQRIEVLYLATLSRRPRPQEWEQLVEFIPENASDTVLQEGLADILWSLLNSAEFTLNH